jgi:hypothetical protein
MLLVCGSCYSPLMTRDQSRGNFCSGPLESSTDRLQEPDEEGMGYTVKEEGADGEEEERELVELGVEPGPVTRVTTGGPGKMYGSLG